MTMDKLLEGINLLGLVALAIMTYVCTVLLRRAIELAAPVLVKEERTVKQDGVSSRTTVYNNGFARWYNEFFLYMLPYICAALFALAHSEYIFGDAKTYMGRLCMAVLVATFSATVYKGVKKAIPGILGVKEEAGSDASVLSVPPKE